MVKHTLRILADERNTTIKQLLIDAVDEAGSLAGAARVLNCAPNAIRYQIKRLNLVAVRMKERTQLMELEQAS